MKEQEKDYLNEAIKDDMVDMYSLFDAIMYENKKGYKAKFLNELKADFNKIKTRKELETTFENYCKTYERIGGKL